jgi:hypothetical protein
VNRSIVLCVIVDQGVALRDRRLRAIQSLTEPQGRPPPRRLRRVHVVADRSDVLGVAHLGRGRLDGGLALGGGPVAGIVTRGEQRDAHAHEGDDDRDHDDAELLLERQRSPLPPQVTYGAPRSMPSYRPSQIAALHRQRACHRRDAG